MHVAQKDLLLEETDLTCLFLHCQTGLTRAREVREQTLIQGSGSAYNAQKYICRVGAQEGAC
jgi:hypothetical protein